MQAQHGALRDVNTRKDNPMATHRKAGSTAVRPPHGIAIFATHLLHEIVDTWQAREERQWLGLVVIPLAMTASALRGDWWMWPLFIVIAWSMLHTWDWLWLLTLELGVVGWQWAYLGTLAITSHRADLMLVGGAWIAFPVALIAAGMTNRHRHHRSMTQFPHGHHRYHPDAAPTAPHEGSR